MANKNPKLGNLKPYVNGRSGNPSGRPVGSRNRIQADFIRALADDFSANGRQAIIACRIYKPDTYLKVIASLVSPSFDIKRPLEGFTCEELESFARLLRTQPHAVETD